MRDIFMATLNAIIIIGIMALCYLGGMLYGVAVTTHADTQWCQNAINQIGNTAGRKGK